MHPLYAESLAEFGTPRELPRCGGWILERKVPDLPYYDAMGCYPIFCCNDWSKLQADLDKISGDLVSISIVADPFGSYDITYLKQCFGDVVIPFKEAFVVDLDLPINTIVSKNRRKKSRKALKNVSEEECREPANLIDEWLYLYDILIKRHHISGIRRFSRMAFTIQLSIPGIVMFRAVHKGITVGATLWYIQGNTAYGHLAAFSDLGYDLMSSYALDWRAIEYFSDKVRWLYFGPGPGITNDGSDGLSLYKRSWSTDTRTVYFCGRIFDSKRYAEIMKAKGIIETDYFPAYRKGEFV